MEKQAKRKNKYFIILIALIVLFGLYGIFKTLWRGYQVGQFIAGNNNLNTSDVQPLIQSRARARDTKRKSDLAEIRRIIVYNYKASTTLVPNEDGVISYGDPTPTPLGGLRQVQEELDKQNNAAQKDALGQPLGVVYLPNPPTGNAPEQQKYHYVQSNGHYLLYTRLETEDVWYYINDQGVIGSQATEPVCGTTCP